MRIICIYFCIKWSVGIEVNKEFPIDLILIPLWTFLPIVLSLISPSACSPVLCSPSLQLKWMSRCMPSLESSAGLTWFLLGQMWESEIYSLSIPHYVGNAIQLKTMLHFFIYLISVHFLCWWEFPKFILSHGSQAKLIYFLLALLPLSFSVMMNTFRPSEIRGGKITFFIWSLL